MKPKPGDRAILRVEPDHHARIHRGENERFEVGMEVGGMYIRGVVVEVMESPCVKIRITEVVRKQ